MILPSQVLFPFINIRRRALQIRKCSEISASIYPYIPYMYTHTPGHRDTNIFANVMLYDVTHKKRQYNLELFFFYTIVFCCVPFFYLEKIKCWPEVNELTTVIISAIFSTRVKISSLRQAMHICSAYTNRIDDHENHICCVSRCTRSSWCGSPGWATGAGNISNTTELWHEYNSHMLTQLHGASRKNNDKKTESNWYFSSFTHRWPLYQEKKKKTYIKAALKQTSGAMSLKGGRQFFWMNLSMFPATEVIVFSMFI